MRYRRSTDLRRPVCGLALACLICWLAATWLPTCSAQAPDEPSEIRKTAEQLVDSVELESLQANGWVKAKRIDQPLLLYTDDTRGDDRGFLWGWGEKGRPLAVFEIFQNVQQRGVWTVCICNTSGGRLRAGRSGSPWWLENDSDIDFNDVPSAPPVATESAVRQRQMKLLAQNFTAHEIWMPNNTRYDLRRLDRPLHSYRDEETGIVEGGLFAFANGTNPEILLFIEARQQKAKASKPVWQFGVGRSAYAELHLEYQGKEVFSAPRGDRVVGRNKPFWTSRLEFAPSAVAPPVGK
jgi:hypothetical protein